MKKDLQWCVPDQFKNPDTLKTYLNTNREIRFISLVGIDFLGNDTDERIPVEYFMKNMADIFSGGIQTDGSSVNLPGIATLNDAKIDFIIDTNAKWFIDHNFDQLSPEGKPVATIRIPIFFKHHTKLVCSRSVLRNTVQYIKKEMISLFEKHGDLLPAGVAASDIKDIEFTLGTELEFWVRSALDNVPARDLEVSQMLKESYWKRTKGQIRTCLEESLEMLTYYGFEPEMGHKEVGGIKGKISANGKLFDVMEQLEINWKYKDPMTACDNELWARVVVKEVFRRAGLEATVIAKPVEGVAGNGEHMHTGIVIHLKNGGKFNLFAPTDENLFLSSAGYGALMGILKNWEIVNPFVTHSNSALKRLKPGFEAPVSIAASLGMSPTSPSRNRSVLACLVRGNNPMSVRFEIRAPNPHTNSYLAMSSFLIAFVDGMKYAAGKSASDLDREIHKKSGESSSYLLKDREYICEHDLFEKYNASEREQLFGKTPATVFEVISSIENTPELYKQTPLSPLIVRSFYLSALRKWEVELLQREIPNIIKELRSVKRFIEHENDLDQKTWESIESLRNLIAKDGLGNKSLVSRLKESFSKQDYAKAGSTFLEIQRVFAEFKEVTNLYRNNIISM
ncbi:MAG TPA: glutamine synthetase [bacterium]|nr:glutamine synthetase [bacterium]